MLVAEFCNLRKVGNTDHLMVLGKIGQFFTDNFGHSSADAGIDFIENQARNTRRFCRNHLYGEADPREFSSGRDTGETLGFRSGNGGDQEFDIIDTVTTRSGLVDTNFESSTVHTKCL